MSIALEDPAHCNFPRLELSQFVGYATCKCLSVDGVNMGRIKNLDEIKAELRAMTGKSKIFRRENRRC